MKSGEKRGRPVMKAALERSIKELLTIPVYDRHDNKGID